MALLLRLLLTPELALLADVVSVLCSLSSGSQGPRIYCRGVTAQLADRGQAGVVLGDGSECVAEELVAVGGGEREAIDFGAQRPS